MRFVSFSSKLIRFKGNTNFLQFKRSVLSLINIIVDLGNASKRGAGLQALKKILELK